MILSAFIGLFFQFFVFLWVLPKEIVVSFVNYFTLQYESVFHFSQNPAIILQSSLILMDVLMFFIGSFIAIKIKRKIKQKMNDKIEEKENSA